MDALEKRLKRRKRIFDKFFKSVNHHFFVTDKNYLKLMKLNRDLDGLVQRGGENKEEQIKKKEIFVKSQAFKNQLNQKLREWGKTDYLSEEDAFKKINLMNKPTKIPIFESSQGGEVSKTYILLGAVKDVNKVRKKYGKSTPLFAMTTKDVPENNEKTNFIFGKLDGESDTTFNSFNILKKQQIP